MLCLKSFAVFSHLSVIQEKQRAAHDQWLLSVDQQKEKRRETHEQWLCAQYMRVQAASQHRANAIPEGTSQCCEGYPQSNGSQCEGCGAEVGSGLPIESPEIFEFEGAEEESAGQQPREKFP